MTVSASANRQTGAHICINQRNEKPVTAGSAGNCTCTTEAVINGTRKKKQTIDYTFDGSIIASISCTGNFTSMPTEPFH